MPTLFWLRLLVAAICCVSVLAAQELPAGITLPVMLSSSLDAKKDKPGETIEGRLDGRIYINGKRLREPYLHLDGRNTSAFPPFVIPKDSYWVMGDNRGNSRDSRFFPNHTIPKKDIIGRVFLRIWPLQRIGIL